MKRQLDMSRDCERGAGSILIVAILAATVLAFALAVPLYRGLAAHRISSAAADASALAAADVAIGIVSGEPCAVARTVAAANGAQLVACELDGLVATVAVTVAGGGLLADSSATAGPPPRAQLAGTKG